MSSIGRQVRLYRRCLTAHLRAVLEYRSDAVLLAAAAVLAQLAGLVFLLTVFSRLPTLAGWKQGEVICVYALVITAEGICSLMFEGIWHLAAMINGGELDHLLVRPMPVVLQVMSSAVGMNGLGNLTLGLALLVAGLTHAVVGWTPLTALWALILLVSAVLVRLGVNLATSSASFWLMSPSSALMYATQALGDLARYPIGVYGRELRIVLTAVPVAFVGFFPAAHLFGRGPYGWVGALTPAVAAGCLLLGGLTFRAGLKRYESSGH